MHSFWHYIDTETFHVLESSGRFFRLYAVFMGIAEALLVEETPEGYEELDVSAGELDARRIANEMENERKEDIQADFYRYLTIPVRPFEIFNTNILLNDYNGLCEEGYDNLVETLGPVMKDLDFLFFNGFATHKKDIIMGQV
jgi:hypothetical protein